MAWDGSGNFNRTNGTNSGASLWQNDRDAGTAILASRHDTHDEDLATGLENCICRDGQNAPSANLPMGGYRHTGVGDSSALTSYPSTKQVQNGAFTYGNNSGGSANAYTISLSPAPTAYVEGLAVIWIPHATNTGATTINVNSLGAQNVRKGDGTVALAAGDLLQDNVYYMYYDGSNFVLLNTNVPQWTTWSPTYGAGGSMTYGTIATAIAKYARKGTEYQFILVATGTTGGSAHSDITFTLPSTPGVGVGGGCAITDTNKAAGLWYTSGGSAIVRRYDSANWGLGAGREIYVQGSYLA